MLQSEGPQPRRRSQQLLNSARIWGSTPVTQRCLCTAVDEGAGAVRIGEWRPSSRTRLLARGCAQPAPQLRRSRARRAALCLALSFSREWWPRSRCNQRETRSGSVETMTSSYLSRSSVW